MIFLFPTDRKKLMIENVRKDKQEQEHAGKNSKILTTTGNMNYVRYDRSILVANITLLVAIESISRSS